LGDWEEKVKGIDGGKLKVENGKRWNTSEGFFHCFEVKEIG